MAQFDVFINPDDGRKHSIPYLLQLQCDLLGDLNTVVVAPLYDSEVVNRPQVKGLTPVFDVEGKKVVMVTPELAGVPLKRLPPSIGNLASERDVIIAALDFLFTGS